MYKEEIVKSVISIIVTLLVLAAFVVMIVLYLKPGNWFKGSRDKQRIEDLNKLSTSLKLYLAEGKSLNTDSLPVDFAKTVDPVNNGVYKYHFKANLSNNTFEINCVLEGDQTPAQNDNGDNPQVYEVGTDLTILN